MQENAPTVNRSTIYYLPFTIYSSQKRMSRFMEIHERDIPEEVTGPASVWLIAKAKY